MLGDNTREILEFLHSFEYVNFRLLCSSATTNLRSMFVYSTWNKSRNLIKLGLGDYANIESNGYFHLTLHHLNKKSKSNKLTCINLKRRCTKRIFIQNANHSLKI